MLLEEESERKMVGKLATRWRTVDLGYTILADTIYLFNATIELSANRIVVAGNH